MAFDVRAELARRPWWMNAMFALSLYGMCFHLPYDIFLKPVAEAEEVWFGITFEGWAARAGEFAHWAVYAIGAWGFWTMRPWLPIAAAAYVFQVAIAHVVWSELDPRGNGIVIGLVQGTIFSAIAVLLLRSRALFTSDRASQGGESDG